MKEQIEKQTEELAKTMKPPTEATLTGLPPKPKVKFDFSALAEADKSTEKRRAAQHLVDITRELIKRKAEGLRLYEPLPTQERFHKSKTRTRLIRGGNRGGKTLSAAAEVARAVSGKDPFDKYPKEGIAYVVGKDWVHIRDTIYPKLFLPGAYKIIRDKTTGMMRAFRPWDQEDQKRKANAKRAEPLIPKRLIMSISWEDKKDKIPAIVHLRTGWRMNFFSGRAEPPQGSDIDLGWLDEEIPNPAWLSELNSRIIDREGRLIWSATPEVGTEQFYDLHQKADEQHYLPETEREIEEFFISLLDNPHITDKAKSDMSGNLTEQEIEVKRHGQFASAGRIVFPEYSRLMHGIEWFKVPEHWTHYAAIDPGHQTAACLFASVPDPSDVLDDPYDLLLWGELYVPKCSAEKFAEPFAMTVGELEFEEFVIDLHGSVIHDVGSGLSVYDQYADAIARKDIRCRRRAKGFGFGNDDIKGGVGVCRQYLATNKITGKPRIRVMCNRDSRGHLQPLLPNFEWEILRWKYKVISGLATDEPETRGRVHLMSTLRYLCSLNPSFIPQKTRLRSDHPMLQIQRYERFAQARTPEAPTPGLRFGPAGAIA